MRMQANSEQANIVHWTQDKENFFETYYIKWNDVEQATAGWIRYTILNASKFPSEAAVWGIFLDKKNPKNNVAIKQVYPLGEVKRKFDCFSLNIANSGIDQYRAWGEVAANDQSMSWDCTYSQDAIMIQHFPAFLYKSPIPSTKFLAPMCWFKLSGTIVINGKQISVNNAQAHEGHFWGKKQVSSWAWSNCSNFKEDPAFYFEAVTAKMHLLGIPQPRMTCLFFYWQNKLYACNSLLKSFFTETQHNLTSWHFKAVCDDLLFVGQLSSKPKDMIIYQFQDPDGQYRYSHNNFFADLVIDIYANQKSYKNSPLATMTAIQTAAFEIAQPIKEPNVEMQVGF